MASIPPSERPGAIRRFRSIFLSDVHLGSRRCKAERLLDFLARCESDFLYLVGDLVERWGPRGTKGWPQTHSQVLAALRNKSDGGTRVVYLQGNHDGAFEHEWLAVKTSFDRAHEHEHTTADGRRFLILHGDRFDRTIHGLRWLSHAGDLAAFGLDVACHALLRFASRGRRNRIALRMKQAFKRASGYTGHFERSAIRWAREQRLDGVICGHSHRPDLRQVDGVHYANGGDWVQNCTAIVEHDDGSFELIRG